ncbi:NUDIX domain-containing protein [Brachybacterium sp. EF45031]|uniref:NUDIX hydrolase n=1 Tax=Brachybacterium sillae TaxID=2810536 RepID=UPI00217E7BAA|nr:NUDIX domain-containing protein [Brachybacterium sillae]MCS6710612.1 NUDIX domain-containing protein [Brachybacterium sillae]
MAIPEFIQELRRHVGHSPLWLTGVSAYVFDADGTHLLVVRRADTGAWTPVTGIIDPGEEPARAAAREVLEEAGIRARVERLADVRVLPEIIYDNGDRARYLDLAFVLRHEAGEPYPADGENTAARWARLDDLPPMGPRFRDQLRIVQEDHCAAQFVR